jgi:S1-C subfamily serine protease
MRKLAPITPLAVLLFLPALARGEERNRFADVLALQKAIHQSIERAEPSIACILVSRSEKYRQYDTVRPDVPGQLGGFDLSLVGRRFQQNDPEYRAIASLDLSNPDNVPESFGSGVVIDAREGLILTQAHVVRNATKIYVRLPGQRGSWADIHAADPRSDLAVLRLLTPPPNLKALRLGDGSKLRKGDFLLSLSNPFAAGYRDGSPSASWGIVSNLRRRPTQMVTDFDRNERARLPLYRLGLLIQTDTRLNLGCSGGALLDLRGELVGLTTSLAGIAGGETPGGFAVPLDGGMHRIIEVLRRGEEVEYGFLGVTLDLLGEREDEERFVHIREVLPGGPAMAGGLKSGYYIKTINDKEVHNNDELFLAIGMHLAGNTVRIGAAQTPAGPKGIYEVTLAKYAVAGPVIASKRPPAPRGLRVDWTSTLPLRWWRNPFIPDGVVIREVQPSSSADKARLQEGMIIARVNNSPVKMPADFYREMESLKGRPVDLTLLTPEGHEEHVTIEGK